MKGSQWQRGIMRSPREMVRVKAVKTEQQVCQIASKEVQDNPDQEEPGSNKQCNHHKQLLGVLLGYTTTSVP